MSRNTRFLRVFRKFPALCCLALTLCLIAIPVFAAQENITPLTPLAPSVSSMPSSASSTSSAEPLPLVAPTQAVSAKPGEAIEPTAMPAEPAKTVEPAGEPAKLGGAGAQDVLPSPKPTTPQANAPQKAESGNSPTFFPQPNLEESATALKETESTLPPATFSWGTYFQAIGILLLMLLGLWFALKFVKRVKPSSFSSSTFSKNNFYIEGQIAISQNKGVYVVRFLNKRLVLGVTDQQINLLLEEEALETKPLGAENAQPQPYTPTFQDAMAHAQRRFFGNKRQASDNPSSGSDASS